VDLKLPNGDRWNPANFDKQVRGPVPMVRALTQSLNLATVNLGLEVGLEQVARTFEQLGLDEAPPAYASMLLGATNLSPVEVAQMYNTLANGGFRSSLRAVRRWSTRAASAQGAGTPRWPKPRPRKRSTRSTAC
jgi:penicillin-binding protein 1B